MWLGTFSSMSAGTGKPSAMYSGHLDIGDAAGTLNQLLLRCAPRTWC